jgi:F-type H+-transporting ATPase subunit a
LISNVVNDNFKVGGKDFFGYLLTMFIFVFLCNITGLVPYTLTVTAQLSITLFFSLTTFIGGNFLCMKLHQTQILQFFLPAGTSLILALILVPIELISYIFRPIALAVRLFANMMAGHTLLKVVSGFV